MTANNKTYDGTTAATLNVTGAALVDVVSGDTVVLDTTAAAGTFANKNVGAGKPVNVTGITISGADAGNYTLVQPTPTANITAKTLTVTAIGQDKVYNGNTVAAVTLSDDRITGDALTLAYTGAAFDTKAVGAGKAVSVSGINVTGADSGNYTFNTTAATTASITAKNLTVSGVIPFDKVYDGTTTAVLNTAGPVLVGVVAGDTVNLDTTAAAGTFADKNVGAGKAVNITGITITGADAGN